MAEITIATNLAAHISVGTPAIVIATITLTITVAVRARIRIRVRPAAGPGGTKIDPAQRGQQSQPAQQSQQGARSRQRVRSALPRVPCPSPRPRRPVNVRVGPSPSRDLPSPHLSDYPLGEAMGWWRDNGSARDGPSAGRYGASRSVPRDAAYRNLEGEYMELQDYCTKLYADYQKTYASYQQLLSSHQDLQSTCSALDAQNLRLREELEKADRLVDEQLEIINWGADVNKEFYEGLKSLQAQRDLLVEGVETLAAVHRCECHDDRLWCAECRYAFPCPTHQIARHCLVKISEMGHS